MKKESLIAPTRHTETRHATPGNACNHFMKYGMTCDDFDRLRARAGGQCELCKTPEQETPRGALIIDHFQGAGLFFVRGLICDRCNSVMSRHDRTAAWGPSSLPWANKARAYHLAAFERPSPEEFERAEQYIASRKPYVVKDRILPPVKRPKVPHIRLDRPLSQIATKLRRHLNAAQVARLIELLSKPK
ncbi:endonuclease domain-containing protein [Streptomyces enissocaesilis]|uniref:Recombination endonuclease VII n=1 Tax=Streptomyces enissocaesilis TaxID=332589 RepID=A0ABN3WXX2_9ACTN